MTEPARSSETTLFVIATAVFAVASLAWAGVVVLRLQPMYRQLFADFGAALPALANAFLEPWLVVLLAALPPAAAASTLVPAVPRDLRPLLLGLAVLLAVAQPIVFFVAMYLPVATLAGSVR